MAAVQDARGEIDIPTRYKLTRREVERWENRPDQPETRGIVGVLADGTHYLLMYHDGTREDLAGWWWMRMYWDVSRIPDAELRHPVGAVLVDGDTDYIRVCRSGKASIKMRTWCRFEEVDLVPMDLSYLGLGGEVTACAGRPRCRRALDLGG